MISCNSDCSGIPCSSVNLLQGYNGKRGREVSFAPLHGLPKNKNPRQTARVFTLYSINPPEADGLKSNICNTPAYRALLPSHRYNRLGLYEVPLARLQFLPSAILLLSHLGAWATYKLRSGS